MKCPSCGHETQPGAKFCVQCGTTLAATSGQTPPAAREGATPKPAAVTPPPLPPASAPSVPRSPATPPVPPASPSTAQSHVSAIPTSRSRSGRPGFVAAGVTVIVVLAVGGFIAFKALFGETGEEPVGRGESPKATPTAPAQSGEASKEAASAAPPATGQESASPLPPATPASSDQAKTGTAGPTSGTPSTAPTGSTPAIPTMGAVPPGASKTDAAPRAATPSASPGAPPKSAPAPAGAATAQAGAQRAPAAQSDRWEQMHQAMLRCAREELLTRFVCEQRVGRQYCEGYWGTVPQCPGTQTRERGQ